MAAPRDHLLYVGHLTGTERNSLMKQRQRSLKKSRASHLQQRWQELKEREFTAQQHNTQLLQQFEEAQDKLTEMLNLTAAMKTIRLEYDRYLEESSPRWKKQLREKTQAARRKRMEEYLKSCLKNTEEQKSSADRPSLSHGPTAKPAAPQNSSQNSHFDYNQDGSSLLSYTQPSWQTHPQSQMARFPFGVPYQSQGSPHVPPSSLPPPNFPHPYPSQLHHLASTLSHHHSWHRQNPPGWASPHPDHPWSWTAGAAGLPSGSEAQWGQQEAPPERREAETHSAPSSKRERGSGSQSSHLSQELDIKPVRLSGSCAESSESSRGSSQASSEKRKKREKGRRSRQTLPDTERCSSQQSSGTSSVIVIAAATVAQSSESDASLEKSRTSSSRRTRSVGLAVGSPKEKRSRRKGDDSGNRKEESRPTGEESGSRNEESRCEKAGDLSPDNESDSCREECGSQREGESGSVSIKSENGDEEEVEKQESSNSEQSSVGEKDEEDDVKEIGDGDEEDAEDKESSRGDEEQEESDVEDDDEASERKNTEEDEESGAEDEESDEKGSHEEQSDRLKDEDGEKGKQGSASSEDEEVDEGEIEEGGESDEEEEVEQRSDKVEAEEDRDSEDIIISPQDKSKTMHIIPEEASQDDDDDEEEEEEEGGSITGSSDNDSNECSDEDDVENLLAPQEQSQKKEVKDPKAAEKPKATCDMVEIFKAEPDRSSKSDHPSDSDEFDHFYD